MTYNEFIESRFAVVPTTPIAENIKEKPMSNEQKDWEADVKEYKDALWENYGEGGDSKNPITKEGFTNFLMMRMYYANLPVKEKTFEEEKKVDIELDISNDDFLLLAKAAHKKDITINEYINEILVGLIKNES